MTRYHIYYILFQTTTYVVSVEYLGSPPWGVSPSDHASLCTHPGTKWAWNDDSARRYTPKPNFSRPDGTQINGFEDDMGEELSEVRVLKSDMDGNLKKFKKEEFGKMVFLFHFGCDFSGSMFILKGVLIGDGIPETVGRLVGCQPSLPWSCGASEVCSSSIRYAQDQAMVICCEDFNSGPKLKRKIDSLKVLPRTKRFMSDPPLASNVYLHKITGFWKKWKKSVCIYF